jgi:hypothetical protein
MPKSGGYGSMRVGDSVATTLKRRAANRVSYNNTRRTPRKEAGTGKLGTVKPTPKP